MNHSLESVSTEHWKDTNKVIRTEKNIIISFTMEKEMYHNGNEPLLTLYLTGYTTNPRPGWMWPTPMLSIVVTAMINPYLRKIIVPLILQWFIDKIYRIICPSMLGTSGGALLMNYSNCLTLGHRDFCENGYCIWRKQRSSSDMFIFSNLPQREKKEKKKLINCLLSATSPFDLSEQFLLHCL